MWILKWFSENAKRLRVDKERIAVAGTRAVGGLYAAVTLMARDRKGPRIAFQIPLYPMIDDRVKTPSRKEDFGNRVWNLNASLFAWKAYRGKLDPKKSHIWYLLGKRI